MRVLVFGHSGTRGLGIASETNFVSNLQQGLCNRFSDEHVEVFFRGWGFLSQERLTTLQTEIEGRQPDYLILDPALTWVTIPMLEPALRRRLPPRLRPLIGKALRFSVDVRAGWVDPRQQRAYLGVEAAMRWAGSAIVKHEPLYSIDHVISFFEQLLRLAKRRETMGIIVLGPKPYSPDLWWARRTPDFSDLATRFQAQLRAQCRRHHVVLFDQRSAFGTVLGPEDLLRDQIHLTPMASRRYASEVAATIAGLEDRPPILHQGH